MRSTNLSKNCGRREFESSALSPLEDLVRKQDELAEKFKSDNALLHNSLAYFGLLSGRFGDTILDAKLGSTMNALATSMLNLTLDTSAASAAAVKDGLNRLASQPLPIGDEELVEGLLAHGRMIYHLLPETDRVLKTLYDLPRFQAQEAVRDHIVSRQRGSRKQATRYRLLLYVTTLILLVVLVNFGLRLRRHMLALRRRATFEHAIATISMALISADSNEVDSGVEQALARLADWGGADRAYFVVSTVPFRLYSWNRNGDWPADWPMRASMLATRMGADAEGVVYVQSVASLPSGPDRDALTRAGLRGWICIVAKEQAENGVLLGFDSLRAPMVWPAGEIGLLRMAVDAVGNAAGRIRLEREQARLEANLQQARRMETVGALTSGIAHNFANIIGAILGHTEMQEMQIAPDSRLARNVAGVRQAAERGRDLIDQIMTFGRRRDSPRRHVCLRSLVAESAALLLASLPDGARLEIAEIPGAAVVYGDLVQLQQVVINLCNNAAQAMDGHGTVEVAIDVEMVAEPLLLSHGHLSPGRYVRLTVTDTGRGMDAVTLEHLFEPFFTTRVGGNGLGLATVREIVSFHGGAIDVESQLGGGSAFRVWLPHVAEAETSVALNRVAPVRGKGETVLLVGDDHARLLHDEEIVAAIGYEPVGFVEPEQALAACRKTPQRFDAVLVSHRMPSTTALAFTKAVHEAAPSLPIVLAAPASELGANALAHAGVNEVVSTPLISVELASALSRCLTD